MKTFKLLIIGLVFLFTGNIQAQVSVNVSVGSPPPWGPVGYVEARYYYLPDVEAYYDIQSSMFIYFVGGAWIHRAYLPPQYRGYDLYGGYKVVMPNYHGSAPYSHFKEHKMKYARGYHGPLQKNIGPKPGKGNNKNNMPPKYNSNNNQKNSNNSGQGNNKNKSNGNGNGKGKKK